VHFQSQLRCGSHGATVNDQILIVAREHPTRGPHSDVLLNDQTDNLFNNVTCCARAITRVTSPLAWQRSVLDRGGLDSFLFKYNL
jgi:hypothetical protein